MEHPKEEFGSINNNITAKNVLDFFGKGGLDDQVIVDGKDVSVFTSQQDEGDEKSDNAERGVTLTISEKKSSKASSNEGK